MAHGSKKVGENRYRETYGRWFEEFSEGDIYEHRPGRTVTQSGITRHALSTMAVDPLHIDRNKMMDSEFGETIADGLYVLSICAGMSVSDWSYKAVAMLGIDNVRFIKPVFTGDTLYAESEVLEARESESRPNFGVVTVETRGYKQTDEQVIEFTRTSLIPKNKKTGDYESHPGDY